MARDNQSLVTLTPPTWNQTVSWTSAATSRGTKKIRRMVSAFGIFIAQTNYIKSTTGPRRPSNWRALAGSMLRPLRESPPLPKLKDVCRYVRSKNAGPFWVTVDLFFDSTDSYADY